MTASGTSPDEEHRQQRPVVQLEMQLTHNLAGAAEPNSKREPSADRSLFRWLPRLVSNIPPYSIRAMGVAVLCFTCALAVQIIFRSIGGSILFATYYPAVLVGGLLAGLPAGVFVTLAALGMVWLVFIPPAFAFQPLTFNQQLDLATFLVSSACILTVTESYRAALRQLRKREQERELVMKELEHRGKNTYAVIDVIVQKTLEDQPERFDHAGSLRESPHGLQLIERTQPT